MLESAEDTGCPSTFKKLWEPVIVVRTDCAAAIYFRTTVDQSSIEAKAHLDLHNNGNGKKIKIVNF